MRGGICRLLLSVAICGAGPGSAQAAEFRRGDVIVDGHVDIGDAQYILSHIFLAQPAPPCLDAGDVDDNGFYTFGDAIWLLNYLFSGGPAPLAPGPTACGEDKTDPLDCASYPAAICASPAARVPDDRFELSIEIPGPTKIHAQPGTLVVFNAHVRLKSPADVGVVAWSVSLESLNCVIIDSRLADDVMLPAPPSFDQRCVTEDGHQATSGVVMDFLSERKIPSDCRILTMRLSWLIPATGCARSELRIVDGKGCGGQPVENIAASISQVYKPVLNSGFVDLCVEGVDVRAAGGTVTEGKTATIPVHLDVSTAEVRGWQYGLCHDPARLTYLSATMGAGTAVVNGGAEPEFADLTVHAGGITWVVLIDALGIDTLPIGTDFEDLRVTYRAEMLAPGDPDPTTSDITPCNPFGDPVIVATYSKGGANIPAMRIPGTVTIRKESASIPLTLGVPSPATLTPASPRQIFTLAAPVGASVLLALADPDPADANALYIRWGDAATPALFDQASDARGQPNQRIVIPSARDQVCSILAEGTVFGGGENAVTLLATIEDLSLERMSATHAAAGPVPVSASILGAGFDASTVFSLRQRGGDETILARDTMIVSPGRAEAVFDLAGAPAGSFDLVAQEPGREARLEGAFLVSATQIGPRLDVHVQAPSRYRYNRIVEILVSYANAGDEEMPAPLLKIVGPPGSELRLSRDAQFRGNEIQVLGIHPDGVAGRLSPGGTGEISLFLRTTHCRSCEFPLEVHSFNPSRETYVGWGTLAPPAGMPAEEWKRAWPGLSLKLGATWAEYEEGLGGVATRLSKRGVSASSVDEVFRFAVREALGRASSAAMGSVRLRGSGIPLADKPVLALEGDRVAASARTDAEGSFAIDWLEAGRTYRLAVGDHSVGDREVTIPWGADLPGMVLEAVPAPDGISPECGNCDTQGLPTAPLFPPPALFTLRADAEVTLISSWDPNEKDGPVGQGEDGLVPPGQAIQYMIHFENLSTATAAAQRVEVTDELDADLDWTSFRIGSVGIGGRQGQSYALGHLGRDMLSGYTRERTSERYCASMRCGILQEWGGERLDLDVDVGYTLDLQTGTVRWVFETVGDDPFAGFLLPNDPDGLRQGEASITFNVKPKKDAPPGTEIKNDALIAFDENPPLRTNAVVNKIGILAPGAEGPSNPFPAASAAEFVDIDAVLDWEPRTWAALYDVYIWREGEAKPSTPTASGLLAPFFRPPSDLDRGTTYHWQVVAQSPSGPVAGPEWSFQTVPELPEMPEAPSGPPLSPGAVVESLRPRLSWNPVARASVYTVYIWPQDQPRPADPIARGIRVTEFEVVEPLAPDRTYAWQIVAANPAGETEGPAWSFATRAAVPFVRANANSDGSLDIGDAIFILNYLFASGDAPSCLKTADTNDSAGIDIADGIYLLNFLFASGPAPLEPFGSCGLDPTPDDVGCAAFPPCAK